MVAVFTHIGYGFTRQNVKQMMSMYRRAGTGKMNCRNKLPTNLIQSSYVTSPNF